ncbi:transcription factor bHLH109 isoform X2 [Brassica rapa]|uniref:transcription factor bHLH109 isoform X2 n=1 Tax=Brassica campestris TaxID=3711 RepID=UPI0004F16004|nr:transcription factor bHLH109 isoform X2 [Brassica rapa]
MEINNNSGTHDEELYSLSEIISSLSSEHHNELNPLQEIFGAHSSSSTLSFSEPKDVTKKSNQGDKRSDCNKNNHAGKRQRSMEYRVLMEKKRRQLIRDKVDILQELTPNCAKSDLATKLESIVEYIKSLKHQIDMMSKAYTEPAGYMAPFYGAQAPCMSPYTSPWCYYAPGIPMMPHQNIPFNPQFHQVYETAPPNQTQI